jgi:hypothetical protein
VVNEFGSGIEGNRVVKRRESIQRVRELYRLEARRVLWNVR